MNARPGHARLSPMLLLQLALLISAPAICADEHTSAKEHVAPDPPISSLPEMPPHQMAAMMGMDDAAPRGRVLFDEAGWRRVDSRDAASWDGWAWYGGDYTRLWLRSAGTHSDGSTDARTELLVDRIVTRWWSLQGGLRQDSGDGPSRTWAAIGLQGLAPGFLETEAAAYIGEDGRTALRVKTEYELLLTQRFVLQPLLELELYGKDDAARGIASGLSEGELGFRLRYEIRREFAPYLGLSYSRRFGGTADLARQSGKDPTQWQWAAGLRFWF